MEKFIQYLFAFAAFQGLLTSVLIKYKFKENLANYLSAISMVFSIVLFATLIYWNNPNSKVLSYSYAFFNALTLLGPLYYGILKGLNFNSFFNSKQALHLVPFLIGFIVLLFDLPTIYITITIASTLYFYLFLSIRLYFKNEANDPNLWILRSFIAFVLANTSYDILNIFGVLSNASDYLITGIMAISIYGLTIVTYLNTKFKSEAKKTLSTTMAQSINTEIYNYLMSTERYLDGDFKLTNLAEELGFSVHQVSEAINSKYGGFYNLVNNMRIIEAKKLLKETNKSIVDVAYSSGYNNKVSFYTAFKKYTNMTPVEWRKYMLNIAIADNPLYAQTS
mgnify:CR=1 FL=1